MTPAMYMRLKDLFVAEGLTAGFKVQWRIWRDTGKDADQFIVFRPSGGTNIEYDRGGDWYVMVDVVSSKSNPDAADAAVDTIVEYISAQSGADDCVGALSLVGNVPAPISTEEGRLVTRLLISCTYGE
ncbi:phage tail termination protein [Raoultella ornithinolytica]|uniref:phage tail termination protein n=1 Tax=Raoultella ornithinolytica TaxID=54291 RepID=UPI00403DECCE